MLPRIPRRWVLLGAGAALLLGAVVALAGLRFRRPTGDAVRARAGARKPRARRGAALPGLPGTGPGLGIEVGVPLDRIIDFPFQDEDLLEKGQRNGGRAWVPGEALVEGGAWPLIVLLHGIDHHGHEPLHRLLRYPQDVTAVAGPLIRSGEVEPVIIAGPSQTDQAGASTTLWPADEFDLARFVQAVDRVLAEKTKVRVLRSRVSVFGHSGAGCVVTATKANGIFRVAQQAEDLQEDGLHLAVLGLMDICFHGEGGGRFLRSSLAGTRARVFGMWVAPEAWGPSLDRDIEEFTEALGVGDEDEDCDRSRFVGCERNDQGWRMIQARPDVLEAAFARGLPEPLSLEPHDALPLWFMEQALLRYFHRH